ncbi:aminoacyl-tRNA hydrolase [Chlamydiota bacterium]
MADEGDGYLIVGLGNPGTKYEKTRHNLGFMVVEALARKQGLSLKRGLRLDGKIASGVVAEKKIYLLMPSTYMNLSGTAVRRAVQYYKIALDHLLVIVDDVYVKFGAMRLRPSGSPGGHNGLKSIEACLCTPDYPRLRMGVGPQEGDLTNGLDQALEDYVLANFTFSEQVDLSQVVDKGVSVTEAWLSQGVEAASKLAGELSTAR